LGQTQESMTKKPPDVFARVIAAIGVFLSIGGLVLSYYGYRWQKQTYEESLEERILVRLSSLRKPIGNAQSALDPKGKLICEVVNIGAHPIYLKEIIGDYKDQQDITLYKYDQTNTTEGPRKLEPGEAASYSADAVFSGTSFEPIDSDKWEIAIATTTTNTDRFARAQTIFVPGP
jgi:hypothetical protein